MSAIEVRLDVSKLKELKEATPGKVDSAVRATAFQVEALAKIFSPVLTGANRNSIYTRTSQGVSGSPGDLGDILPNVELGEAVVGPSMEYSMFLEYGTSKMAAQPYLTPAAEQAPKLFDANIKLVFK